MTDRDRLIAIAEDLDAARIQAEREHDAIERATMLSAAALHAVLALSVEVGYERIVKREREVAGFDPLKPPTAKEQF